MRQTSSKFYIHDMGTIDNSSRNSRGGGGGLLKSSIVGSLTFSNNPDLIRLKHECAPPMKQQYDCAPPMKNQHEDAPLMTHPYNTVICAELIILTM